MRDRLFFAASLGLLLIALGYAVYAGAALLLVYVLAPFAALTVFILLVIRIRTRSTARQ